MKYILSIIFSLTLGSAYAQSMRVYDARTNMVSEQQLDHEGLLQHGGGPGHGGGGGHPAPGPHPGPAPRPPGPHPVPPPHPGPGPHPGPHPGPGPGPHPGPHPGPWRPYPGWHDGWRWNRGWHPIWWVPGIIWPPWYWGDVPLGYWQCTAFNQNLQPFSAFGPDMDQAAYGALYACGGPNFEQFGCYIPPGYCQVR